MVSEGLQREFANGKAYYKRPEKQLTMPPRNADWPDLETLRWHNEDGGIIPVGVARPRAGGSGRSGLAVGTNRAAGPRRRRRWATPRNEIVS